nr:MAG TPA: hypothetical protein [Caudoviricetes sp.]
MRLLSSITGIAQKGRTPRAVPTAEKEQETKIEEAIDKLLEDWK